MSFRQILLHFIFLKYKEMRASRISLGRGSIRSIWIVIFASYLVRSRNSVNCSTAIRGYSVIALCTLSVRIKSFHKAFILILFLIAKFRPRYNVIQLNLSAPSHADDAILETTPFAGLAWFIRLAKLEDLNTTRRSEKVFFEILAGLLDRRC